jgi:hypothetical protein
MTSFAKEVGCRVLAPSVTGVQLWRWKLHQAVTAIEPKYTETRNPVTAENTGLTKYEALEECADCLRHVMTLASQADDALSENSRRTQLSPYSPLVHRHWCWIFAQSAGKAYFAEFAKRHTNRPAREHAALVHIIELCERQSQGELTAQERRLLRKFLRTWANELG